MKTIVRARFGKIYKRVSGPNPKYIITVEIYLHNACSLALKTSMALRYTDNLFKCWAPGADVINKF